MSTPVLQPSVFQMLAQEKHIREDRRKEIGRVKEDNRENGRTKRMGIEWDEWEEMERCMYCIGNNEYLFNLEYPSSS